MSCAHLLGGRRACGGRVGRGRAWRGVRLRRPRLDRLGRAAAGAGAAAQALLVVVDDRAVHGDPFRHLHGAVGLMAHEAPERAAEGASAAVRRRVQQLVHVEEVTALGGARRAVGGALAAAHAELLVAQDLAADADGALQRAAGHAAEDLAAAMGERHQAAPLAAASGASRVPSASDRGSGSRPPITRSISLTAATNLGGSPALIVNIWQRSGSTPTLFSRRCTNATRSTALKLPSR